MRKFSHIKTFLCLDCDQVGLHLVWLYPLPVGLHLVWLQPRLTCGVVFVVIAPLTFGAAFDVTASLTCGTVFGVTAVVCHKKVIIIQNLSKYNFCQQQSELCLSSFLPAPKLCLVANKKILLPTSSPIKHLLHSFRVWGSRQTSYS